MQVIRHAAAAEDKIKWENTVGIGDGTMWFNILWAVWLLTVSILDFRSRRVPFWILGAGGVMVMPEVIRRWGDYPDILLGMLPGFTLLAVAFATKKAGYGDGIVLLLLGMVLGRRGGLMVFGIALFLAAVCSAFLLVIRKAGRNTKIPFLPFLAVGWVIVMVF